MMLSKNFSLEEIVSSQIATRRGIDNSPTESHMLSLQTLIANLVQPLRDFLGKPMVISSGYRSLDLNKAVGGSVRSQHSRGEAIDFTVIGMDNREVCFAIINSGISFDQLIYEGGWIHLSYNTNGKQRNQVLTATFTKSGVSYSNGVK